jgi:hypothetical protein
MVVAVKVAKDEIAGALGLSLAPYRITTDPAKIVLALQGIA